MKDNNTALLLLNIQNDFLEWGSVGVPNSIGLPTQVNSILPHYHTVISITDWHPATHVSFAGNHPWRKPGQIIRVNDNDILLWTMHAVADSFGAELSSNLNQERITKHIQKGKDENVECFSPFYDVEGKVVSRLHDYLQFSGITDLDLVGMPFEFDIKQTALDAVKLGYNTSVIVTLCRSINPEQDNSITYDLMVAGVDVKTKVENE